MASAAGANISDLLNQLRESRQVYQRQAGAILVGAMMPWLANVLFVANLSPVPHVDLTPAAFTISALTFAWALFSFRLLDLVPVARGAVLDMFQQAGFAGAESAE